MTGVTPNICAGGFGAVYDVYIERPWLMAVVGRLVWGIDASVLYAGMAPLSSAEDMTILDVPCGGGVALRALRPDQKIRYLAIDISSDMIRRAERRARERSLSQVEFLLADMTQLPLADDTADMVACFSGLHMLADPREALAELARCLRPGGRLFGTTFVLDGLSRRGRRMFATGSRRGHPMPPRRGALLSWFKDAGFSDATVGPQAGFAAFSAHRDGA